MSGRWGRRPVEAGTGLPAVEAGTGAQPGRDVDAAVGGRPGSAAVVGGAADGQGDGASAVDAAPGIGTDPEWDGDRPVLEVSGLIRRYGSLLALGELDLEVGPGELIVLVGPNGAGKSTLLGCIAGLLDASGGEVRIAGARAGSLRARAATSYLADEPVLYDDLSLAEHLEYVARLHGVVDWETPAADLLTRLGLDERVDDLPAHFSKGMRQKTSIALALLRPFSLLVADEPFDGLDPPSRDTLADLLSETAASGAAVIVSTHRLDIAERADRALALSDGRLIYDGPADAEVMEDFLPY